MKAVLLTGQRPALIVIDIQAETFFDREDEAIPTMTGYVEIASLSKKTLLK